MPEGRQERRGQRVKMVCLPEEHGQVGGDGIHQLLKLSGFACLQHLAVCLEAVKPQLPQPFGQPAIHQITLGIGEHNAGVLIDQRTDAVKIRIGEWEFAFCVHGYASLPSPAGAHSELDPVTLCAVGGDLGALMAVVMLRHPALAHSARVGLGPAGARP